MDVLTATKDFEKWVGSHTHVVKTQLSEKHKQMAESPVQFLRGTFYRWTQMFPETCPDLGKAPSRALGGRSAHRELRHVAGRIWTPDLGH